MSPAALSQASLKLDASKLCQNEAEFVQNARRLSRFTEKQESWLLAIAARYGVRVSEADVAPEPEPVPRQERPRAPRISYRDREPDPFRAQTAAALRDMRAAGLHRKLSPAGTAKPSVADRMRLKDAISPPSPMAVCYGQLGTPSARPYGTPPAPSVGFGMDPREGVAKMVGSIGEKWTDQMYEELDRYRHSGDSKLPDGSYSWDPDFQDLDMSIWGLPD